jgi:hypothetical protein
MLAQLVDVAAHGTADDREIGGTRRAGDEAGERQPHDAGLSAPEHGRAP